MYINSTSKKNLDTLVDQTFMISVTIAFRYAYIIERKINMNDLENNFRKINTDEPTIINY